MTGNQRHEFKSNIEIPENWLQFQTIDMHTGGEPLRVLLNGLTGIKGDSILECRNFMKVNHDLIRQVLMLEPRGHSDMYGAIVLKPFHDAADFSVLFMHNEGYSTMCGHAVIALSKLAINLGWVKSNKVNIEAPCGIIKSQWNKESNLSSFEGVPSFVVSLGNQTTLPSGRSIIFDLAYGGAFYSYVDSLKHGISLDKSNAGQLIELGMAIKNRVIESDIEIKHPYEKDLSFLYGTIFVEDLGNKRSKNVCVFADGEIDRSPTGSGVMGRLAIHYSKNEIGINDTIQVESIIGSQFKGKILREVDYGEGKAIIPMIEGEAYITGQHTFIVDPSDPLRDGFIIR